MNEEKVRAFICIDFPDEVIKEVARIQRLIENKLFIGKFVELENLHLTLKFLGEIDKDKLEEVKKRLLEIKIGEFEVKLGEIGIFHSKKYDLPKIIWLKVNSKEIWDLQKIIELKLKELFSPEKKFKAHISIARLKYVNDKVGFREFIKNINVKKIKFQVDCFKIKSSELKNNGPIYRDIQIYNLNK